MTNGIIVRSRSKTVGLLTAPLLMIQALSCTGCSSGPSTSDEGEISKKQEELFFEFTGAQLFRGIYFRTGPAADALPELPTVTEVNPTSLANLVREAAARRSEVTYRAPGCGFLGLHLCEANTIEEALKFSADQIEQTPLSASEVQGQFEAFRSNPLRQTEVITRIRLRRPFFFAEFGADIRSGNPFRVADALQRATDEFLVAHLPAFTPLPEEPGIMPIRPLVNVDLSPADTVVEIETAVYAVAAVAVAVAAVAVAVVGDDYGSDTLLEQAFVADVTAAYFQPSVFDLE